MRADRSKWRQAIRPVLPDGLFQLALSVLTVVMLLSVPGCCWPGDDCNGGNPNGIIPPVHIPIYTQTVVDQGTIADGSHYKGEHYKAAEPAQTQLKNGTIPNVIEEHGNLLVLDITSWPDGWSAGNVVTVRMLSGIVQYKRLLVRFRLDDGRLAITVASAGVLEVMDTFELTVDGDLGALADRSKAIRKTSAKIITPVDFIDERTVSLIDKKNISLYPHKAGAVGADLTVTELSLTAKPRLRAKLVIDKPDTATDIVEQQLANMNGATNTFLNANGAQMSQDPLGALWVVTLSTAQTLTQGVQAAVQVQQSLEGAIASLTDPNRIVEAYAIVDGDITGKLRILATATASYHPDEVEIPLVPEIFIPITGPVPIGLTFEVVGVASIGFDGRISVTSGADLTIPFYSGVKILNGQFQEITLPSLTPSFTIIDPNFDGTRAYLRLAAGVECRAGVSLATILSATLDPRAQLVFETMADVTGNTTAGAVNLDWKLFGELTARLTGELDLKLLEPMRYRWDTGLNYKIPLADGNWQGKWGYTLTVNNGTGSGSYVAGKVVPISATVPDNKFFKEWTGNTENVADPNARQTTVTMKADVTVTAVFEERDPNQYTLTVNVEGQGTTDPTPGNHPYDAGTLVPLTATASEG